MGLFGGISHKKALKVLKSVLPKLKMSFADKKYRKTGIDYEQKVNDFGFTSYKITHLFATKYHNSFAEEILFSKDRRILKEKNGRVTKYGPWEYWARAAVYFEALPMSGYTQTQAKLKEIYPSFQFSFMKDSVMVYKGKTIKNLKEAKAFYEQFARDYKKISNDLVKSMNYIHDELHK